MTKLFVLPLALHVLLTLWIGMRSLRARVRAIKSGSAKIHEIATDNWAWPRRVKQLGNNFDNQFETPMFWYGHTALVVALGMVDHIMVSLSWLYLMSRVAHSFIHTGNNDVPSRLRVFLFGFFVLVVAWMWLMIRLFLNG